MARQIICLLPTSLIAMIITSGCSSSVRDVPGSKPADATPAPQKPAKMMGFGGCLGIVTAIGDDWVEIGAGWEGVTINNKKQWDEKDTEKPRRLSAKGTFVGGDLKGHRRGETYRLIDLKIGDRVVIETSITSDKEYCLEIMIQRRPGGKIPPVPDQPFPESFGSHLRNQAEQDWEEHRIPIPAPYLDPNGQAPWTNPPYMPLPAAPPPRAVIPAAKP